MAQRQFRLDDTSVWNDRWGEGTDGAVTYSSNQNDPTQATPCSGTISTTTLTVGSSTGFADGNLILIYQSREGGDGAGNWELNKITSGTSGTSWTLTYPLTHNYSSTAQVILLKQYSSFTINSGVTLYTQGWNGSTGGVTAILCNGTTSIPGSISAQGAGYSLGTCAGQNIGRAGEGNTGASPGQGQTSANGSGGGGGGYATDSGHVEGGNGGGGSNATLGTNGNSRNTGVGGSVGNTSGNATNTIITMGGGGGSGGRGWNDSQPAENGGNGGGIVIIISRIVNIGGSLLTYGNNGNSSSSRAAGGAGAGGSVLIKGQVVTYNIGATGGTGGVCTGSFGGSGGNGGSGNVVIEYSVSASGSSSPAATTTFNGLLSDPNPNYVKFDIKATTRQDMNVLSNIRKNNNTQNNSAKANLIKYRGIMDSYVIANFARSHYEKKYDYRVYDTTGTAYITTWSAEVITEPSFRQVINGGPGELVVRLKRDFDNFGEGEDITLYNRVELWCADRDNKNGVMIYAGFISGYRPVLDGQKEYVEITLLHDITQFSQIIYRAADGSTTISEASKDPSQIFRDVLDRYAADGGRITYTSSSIDNTNTTVTYDFSAYSIKDAVDKAIELSPDNWYWRVDPDNVFHLHTSNFAAADHTFYIGKHINYMETWRRGEDIVNRVYFVGGGSPSLYRVYSNNGSISSYGIHATTYVDQRVELSGTADYIANRILNEKKDPEIRTTLTIVDNNGLDAAKGYDIESVKVGQTLRIFGLKAGSKTVSLWDIMQWDVDVWDQTIAAAATDILQIQSVSYEPNKIQIEASSRLPIISKRIEDVNRNLVQSQTDDTPSSPTVG